MGLCGQVGSASAPAGLLAVHAHPDDETLATGALLAAWAGAGLPVTVVTCTRGELGEVIGPDPAHLEGDGPALAARRELELAAALEALGVSDHAFLDELAAPLAGEGLRRFADSGMAWAATGRAGRLGDLPDDAFVAVGLDEAARPLARLLRERRPAVVVTYEPGGGYGHPDHVRAHEVTMRALELAADVGAHLGGAAAHVPGAVLWAVVGAGVLRSAYRELPALAGVAELVRTGVLTAPDPAGPLASVAVPDGDIEVVVDVAGVLDLVAAALAAHATQVHAIWVDPARAAAAARPGPAGDALPVVIGCYALSNDVIVPLLSRESYRRARGATVSVDDVAWPAGVRPVA